MTDHTHQPEAQGHGDIVRAEQMVVATLNHETRTFTPGVIPREQAGDYPGLHASVDVLAEITPASQEQERILVLHHRDEAKGREVYFVAHASWDSIEGQPPAYHVPANTAVELQPDVPVHFGRDQIGNKDLPATTGVRRAVKQFISEDHGSVTLTPEGQLQVTDHSASKTTLRYMSQEVPATENEGERTDAFETAGTAGHVEVAAVETTAEQAETPTPAEIFATPNSFEQVLHDTDTDPDVRRELHAITNMWHELQVSVTTNELWNEVIRPRLGDVSETAQQAERDTRVPREILDTLNEGLRLITNASDTEGVLRLLHQYPLGALGQQLASRLQIFAGEATMQRASQILDLDTLESDERMQTINRSAQEEFDPAQAEALVSEVQPTIEAATTLAGIRQTLSDRLHDSEGSSKNWRQHRQAIDDVIQFARLSGRLANDGDLLRQALQLRNELQGVEDRMRAGQPAVAELGPMSQRVTQLREPFERIHRATTVARVYADEAR